MTAPELKPCPFCGAVDPEWLASHVVCDCGATGPRQDVDREYQADAMRALTDWNRRADLAHVQPAQVLEICGKCMGSGYGGHPDSGQLCADCNGSGGVEPQPDTRDEVIARLVDALTGYTFSKRYSHREMRGFLARQGDFALSTEGFLCQKDDGECMA